MATKIDARSISGMTLLVLLTTLVLAAVWVSRPAAAASCSDLVNEFNAYNGRYDQLYNKWIQMSVCNSDYLENLESLADLASKKADLLEHIAALSCSVTGARAPSVLRAAAEKQWKALKMLRQQCPALKKKFQNGDKRTQSGKR